MTRENVGCFEVLWPRAERRQSMTPLAKRFDTLNGKRIVQLWDYAFRGDEIFALLEEGLRQHFSDLAFVSWREFESTHGPQEREVLASFPARFKQLGVDAAISAMAC